MTVRTLAACQTVPLVASLATGIRRQGGVALVAVLWMVAALGLLLSALMAVTRADISAAGLARDRARAAAIGDAVIQLGIRERRLNPPPAEEVVFARKYEFDGVEVEFRLRPGSGFLNLNSAEAPLIAAVLQHVGGMQVGDAEILAQRIVDWRTSDAAQVLREEFRAAGFAALPREGPYETVADLMQVLGMSREVFARIAPLATVHDTGRLQGINPQAAPDALLPALADGDAARVQRYLTERVERGALADATVLEQQFLVEGGDLIFHAEAVVLLNGRQYQRARWVEVNRPGELGEPWATLEIEPVRVLPQGEMQHGT